MDLELCSGGCCLVSVLHLLTLEWHREPLASGPVGSLSSGGKTKVAQPQSLFSTLHSSGKKRCGHSPKHQAGMGFAERAPWAFCLRPKGFHDEVWKRSG